MRIQTLSILAGTAVCNARCPFCISKMTPPHGVALKPPESINWRNFRKACLFAKQSSVTTAMITGKGEPTLFPDQVTDFLTALAPYDFPFIELQTNGIAIGESPDAYATHLRRWYELGMTMVAVSIVHYKSEPNRQIYVPYKSSYIDLRELITRLHSFGFAVRLACVMADSFIDTPEELNALVAFAAENKVEQLKVSPVTKPEDNRHPEAYDWTMRHHLSGEKLAVIQKHVAEHATPLMHLMHGATVYDFRGQNLCLSNCLTIEPQSEDIRQLIFFPDGHLRYDWQYSGAILI